MAEVLKTYPLHIEDGHVQGDHIGIQVLDDGMHLDVKGLPFLETTEDHMPCPQTGKKILTTRQVAHVVPPGGTLQIAFSADGTITISQL